MPPNVNGSFDRQRMVRRVHGLTAGVAIAATAATLGLTGLIAGGQADAETGTGDSATEPAASSSVPNPAGSTGALSAPSTHAPSQLSQAPVPSQTSGRSHAGSGGS